MNTKFIVSGAIFCLLLAACGDDKKITAQNGNRPGVGGDQCLVKTWNVRYQTKPGAAWTRNDFFVSDQASFTKKYGRVAGAALTANGTATFATVTYSSSADLVDQVQHCQYSNRSGKVLPAVKPIGYSVVKNGANQVSVRWGCYVSCKQMNLVPRTTRRP